MNRYKSSQEWRKVQAGWYQSPGTRYDAQKTTKGHWQLRVRRDTSGGRKYALVGSFVTLADCQEHAKRWRPC